MRRARWRKRRRRGSPPSMFQDTGARLRSSVCTMTRSGTTTVLSRARKPVGAVIQFRLSTHLDPGLALRSHAAARDPFEIHPLAALLHDRGLQTYTELAGAGSFRRSALTCWARVPSPLKDSADDFFLPNFKHEFKNQGLAGLPRALAESWKASSGRQIAIRTIDNEEAAFAEAEKTFRLIEQESERSFRPRRKPPLHY